MAEGCAGINFEQEKYRIGTVTVRDPFDYLRWIRSKSSNTQAQLTTLLSNHDFTYQLARDDALALIERQRFLPETFGGLRVSVETVSAANCRQKPNTLDLIYTILSTSPPKILSGTAESQDRLKTVPQDAMGLRQGGTPVRFTPAGGYNNSERVFGGGRLEASRKIKQFPVFDTFTAEGKASSTMQQITTALEGSADTMHAISHVDWRVHYFSRVEPAKPAELRRGSLSAQFSAATRPFAGGAMTFRFGGLIEGGNMQSSFSRSQLAGDTVASAGFGAIKSYAGLASRLTHNVLSASYGLELGSIGPSTRVDWRKHIVDIADEFWIPLRPHYALEVEGRFTAGLLQVPGVVPVGERFFGGNAETYFVPGDTWQIRANPVIRAIPANRFGLTSQGAGGSSFASVNWTAAFPVKAWPLVPLAVKDEATPLLDGQITSATSVEQNFFSWKDPAFQEILKLQEPLRASLTTLRIAVEAAKSENSATPQLPFTNCSNQILLADFNAKMAGEKKDITQYGLAVAPIRQVAQLLATCRLLNQPSVDQAGLGVEKIRAQIEQADARIQPAAKIKATADTAFVRRTIRTLMNDMNVFSISPVVVFDVARIGPASSGMGMRYGPGGGVRLSVASYVNFTVGYAWNVGRRPGEGPGALFVTIGIRDLFQ